MVLVLLPVLGAGTALGALKLDNYTLDKTLARLSHSVSNFLIAEVPVQDGWWDARANRRAGMENDDIRERYKLVVGDFPAYLLFDEAHKKGLRYPGEVKAPDIAVWLRTNGINMPAIGTIADLDEIVGRFLADKGEEHIAAAKALAEGHLSDDRKAAMYVKIMERIRERGDGFVKAEKDRLTKILQVAKVWKDKRDELQDKLNVLDSFDLVMAG